MAQAFPLQWPKTVPRAARQVPAAFGKHTLAQAVAELRNQVNLLGPRVLVLSTNVPLREDGLPYSNPGKIKDPGAVLYFNKPFDSYAYGNLSLTQDQFNALDPARAYELTVAPIAPALFFEHCQTCNNLLPDNQHTGTCDECIPF